MSTAADMGKLHFYNLSRLIRRQIARRNVDRAETENRVFVSEEEVSGARQPKHSTFSVGEHY